MRRFIALTTVAAVALLLLPFQEAQASHIGGHLNAKLTAPGDGSVLVNRDTALVSFDVDVSDGQAVTITSVKVTIDGAVACESTFSPDPENPRRSVSGNFSWNTAATVGGSVGECQGAGGALPAGGAAANGDYNVSLTATAVNMFTNEPQNNDDSAGIITGHAPVAPTGVTARRDGHDIVVSWNANPEPDLRDYVVSECQSGLKESCSDWQDVATVPATVRSVTLASAGEGSYAYRVAARRDGAGEPRTSAYTASSPSTVNIDEPAPKSGKGRDDEPTGPAVTAVEDDAADDSSASSGGSSSGVSLPSRRIVRATPSVANSVDGDDRGFDELLPYAGGGALPDGGQGGGADERALLIPLAGGALLLVLSGMAWYVNRRSGLALEPLPVEELGDWNGPGNGNGHVTVFRDDDTLVGAGRR